MSGLAEDSALAAVDPGGLKAFDYGSISQHEVDPQTFVVVVEIPRMPIAEHSLVWIQLANQVGPTRFQKRADPRALIFPEPGPILLLL